MSDSYLLKELTPSLYLTAMLQVRDRLTEEVAGLRAAQQAMVEEKGREGAELQASIEEGEADSQAFIQTIRRGTQTNIKVQSRE